MILYNRFPKIEHIYRNHLTNSTSMKTIFLSSFILLTFLNGHWLQAQGKSKIQKRRPSSTGNCFLETLKILGGQPIW